MDWETIIKLWQANSEWGGITKETLQKWIEAPYENCDISLAKDDANEVVGMCFLTYTRFNTPKGICKAVRLSAPVISNQLKGLNLLDPNHPINRLFAFSFQIAVSKGIDLAYMNPLASWVRVLRISHNYGLPRFYIKEHKFFKALITGESNNGQFSYQLVTDFNAEHENAWLSFIDSMPDSFAINRTVDWMKYKSADFLKVEARNDQQEIVGVLVYKPKQKLVYDFFQRIDLGFDAIGVGAISFSLRMIGPMTRRISASMVSSKFLASDSRMR